MFRMLSLTSRRSSRFFFLLVALVVLMLVSPFLDDSPLHSSFLVALFTFVMLSTVRVASDRRGHRIVTLTIGVLWLVLSVGDLIWQIPDLAIYANLLFSLFSLCVLCIVLSNVVSAVEVDFDILLGAASVYLLIGMVWTTSYLVIHQIDPAAFSLVHGEALPYFHQFLYFSLTTLTTLGFGDVTPVSPFAQVWSTLEAVAGTLYMALLVARLVGLYKIRQQ